MGRDIAAIFVKAGWHTQLVARTEAAWPAIAEHVRSSVRQLGGLPDLACLQLQPSLEAVEWNEAAVVIETVTENLALKREIFAQLDKLVPKGVPIGSNSSGMRITDIAAACTTKERMANAHFFLPAHLVPLVEIAQGEATSTATVECLQEVFKTVGRVPVRVNRDMPGLLANRIQHALMREAFAVIDSGLASAEDVDAAVRFGFGFRYVAAGPILQKEFAGLDTQLAAATSIYPSLCNDSTPSDALRARVAAGHLGTKSNHGFWRWTDEEIASERARYEQCLLRAAALLAGGDAGSVSGAVA
jgi:3-hydroxybutyryl-CoA dehydrogenase